MAHVIQMAAHGASPHPGQGSALYRPRKPVGAPLPFPHPPSRRSPAIVLWHLLSLDAPTVAVLWTWFTAHTCGVAVNLASLTALFATVWLLYTGDRLLDAQRGERGGLTEPQLEARHRFHQRHRKGFLFGIVAASFVLAFLLPAISMAALYLYLVEGSFLIGYFLLIHASSSPRRLPKEFAVGLFFAAATFIPTVAVKPNLRPVLLLPATLFAALCTLNCLTIYAWEHPTESDRAAHVTTRLALRSLPATSIVLFLMGVTGIMVAPHRLWPISAAVSLSAALLLLLHRTRQNFHPTTLRAAADLALLTPVLFLLW